MGANKDAFKTFVLDYGSMVYGTVSKTLLKKLEVAQNQALRLGCEDMNEEIY